MCCMLYTSSAWAVINKKKKERTEKFNFLIAMFVTQINLSNLFNYWVLTIHLKNKISTKRHVRCTLFAKVLHINYSAAKFDINWFAVVTY